MKMNDEERQREAFLRFYSHNWENFISSSSREAETMKLCDHENIVKLYGVCCETEPLIIVME